MAACEELRAQGQRPTQRAVRQALGGGSFGTIASHIRAWQRQQLAPPQPISADPASLAELQDLLEEPRRLIFGELERAFAAAAARLVARVNERLDRAAALQEAQLSAERAEQRRQLDDADRLLEETAADARAIEARAAGLESQLATAVARSASLETELRAAIDALEMEKRNHAATDSARAAALAEARAATMEVTHLREALRRENEAHRSEEAARRDLAAEKSAAEAARDLLERTCAALETRLAAEVADRKRDADRAAQALDATRAQAQREMDRLATDLAAAIARHDATERRLQAAEIDRAQALSALVDAQATIGRLSSAAQQAATSAVPSPRGL